MGDMILDDEVRVDAVKRLDEAFRKIIQEVYTEEINRAIYAACKKTLDKAKAKHFRELQKIYNALKDIPHYTHTMDRQGTLATVVVLDDVKALFPHIIAAKK